MTTSRLRRREQWIGLIGALCIAVGLMVSNASATFQGAATASNSITTAQMSITVGTNNVTTGATLIAPGDTIDRVIDLTPAGSSGMFNGWTLTTTGSGNALDTQCAASCNGDGLQVQLDVCNQAWTGTVAVTAYTCGGSSSTVLSSTNVIVTNSSLSNMSNSAINRLRIRMTFPGGSSNDDSNFQNLSETITFTFHGVQRAGTVK